MADQPLVLTEYDVKDSNLLLRYLRKSAEQVLSISNRLKAIEAVPPAPTVPDVRNALQATGQVPINVTGLLGVLAQPQPASASVYAAAPTGQVLQSLRDQQLVLVGTASTGFSLNVVIGGNPNTLSQLVTGLTTATVSSTSTNLMTLDTAQTSTGAKSLTLAAGAVSTPSLTFSSSTSNGIYTTSSGSFSLGVLGAQVVGLTTAGVSVVKTLTSYNGDALTGNGVAAIVGTVASTGKTAAAAGAAGGFTSNVYQPLSSGEYAVQWYINCVTSGTGVVTPAYRFNDGLFTNSISPTPFSLTAAGLTTQGLAFFHATTSTNIQFQISSSSTLETGSFSYWVSLQRLS